MASRARGARLAGGFTLGPARLPVAGAAVLAGKAGPAALAGDAVEATGPVRAGVARRHGDTHCAIAGNVAEQIDDPAVVHKVAVGDRDAIAIGAVTIAPGRDNEHAPGAVIGATRGRFGCQRGKADKGQGTGTDKMADHEEPRITLLMPFLLCTPDAFAQWVDRLLSIRLLSIIGRACGPPCDELERIRWLSADQAQEKACPSDGWLSWVENLTRV